MALRCDVFSPRLPVVALSGRDSNCDRIWLDGKALVLGIAPAPRSRGLLALAFQIIVSAT